MIMRLFQNHVLANLLFVLVLVIGFLSYNLLPRQQDPTINFNWVVVTTVLPGASAEDIEKRVTDPLEDAIQNISDIKFASSNSREGVSSLLVRFEDIDSRTFDKRVNDLRREIQNVEDELPANAIDPVILEITSANAFPSVTVAVTALDDDENLRIQARNIEEDLERLVGVDRVDPVGLDDPELQITFDPSALQALNLSPTALADTVAVWFKDISAGSVEVGGDSWLVRLVGREAEPDKVKTLPLIGLQGEEITLSRVADVQKSRKKASQDAVIDGQPAIVLAVMKKDNANTIELVDRVKAYMDQRNQLSQATGVKLVLVDDQTVATTEAIQLMQNNALIGLLLVLLVAWLFLGGHIAFLTAIGIPFILAGTFWVLWGMGETLNVTVLLGVVIVLGMLVDDAVVVVEAIYYRLQLGQPVYEATMDSLSEVGRPVISAVLTTMAAFLPLMLLPGILGDFMRVIPMVVTIALAISLIEAFWMLPVHVSVARVRFDKQNKMQHFRVRMTHKIQISYVRILIKAMRRPVLTFVMIGTLFISAMGALGAGLIKVDFFAADPLRLFYVNLEMAPQTPLSSTLDKVKQMEQLIRKHLKEEDIRAVVGYAGQQFTEIEPMFGEQYGQVLVGLKPKTDDNRSVDELLAAVREDALALPGPVNISFLRLAGGPPVSKPISIKVRGDEYDEIRSAADALKAYLSTVPEITDITDDAGGGRMTLSLKPDYDAITQSGLHPLEVIRTTQLLVDGEIVADMQHEGEKLEVRVRAIPQSLSDIDQLLEFKLPVPGGGQIALNRLVSFEREQALGNIRHYNFRRAITVEADILPNTIDTVTANAGVIEHWENQLQEGFPNLDLDFSGELDDIQESMDAIGVLFIFGVGLMYLILGTQFSSYFQPLMILMTIPMAFTGVVMGLLVTQNPLSLFTMYGVVALAGIAVNAAIVLISAGNQRLEKGMTVKHATLYAARRRVIPILITSLTTIAGLFSLATGLGGHSLIWGPVATAIVSGLAFSTVLTLILIPMLYRIFMQWSHKSVAKEL
jgi:multidrug efflux pump subunit AcrB